MGKNESREVAYLLDDVMQKKFEYGFYQEELWEYVKKTEKPVLEYNMEDVKHWIYTPCWSYHASSTEECFISVYQVLLQEARFTQHIERIQMADLQYPLIVMEDEFDKYGTILDGNHRFAKLILKKVAKVRIQFISKEELIEHLYRKI